jgi:hypothetical protein
MKVNDTILVSSVTIAFSETVPVTKDTDTEIVDSTVASSASEVLQAFLKLHPSNSMSIPEVVQAFLNLDQAAIKEALPTVVSWSGMVSSFVTSPLTTTVWYFTVEGPCGDLLASHFDVTRTPFGEVFANLVVTYMLSAAFANGLLHATLPAWKASVLRSLNNSASIKSFVAAVAKDVIETVATFAGTCAIAFHMGSKSGALDVDTLELTSPVDLLAASLAWLALTTAIRCTYEGLWTYLVNLALAPLAAGSKVWHLGRNAGSFLRSCFKSQVEP